MNIRWSTTKKKNRRFGGIKIEKKEFNCSESAIEVTNVDVGKVVISEVFPWAKKGSKYLSATKIMKMLRFVACSQE